MRIRRATGKDRRAWKLLRRALWPDCSERDHQKEMRAYLERRGQLAVFLAELPDDSLVGFAEVSMRPDPELGDKPPIGYLEGLFVTRKARRHGVGRALVSAAEAWARSRGARKMGSDTALSNRVSRATHRALGYRELERLVHFGKQFRSAGDADRS